ncbi:hypothetical protein [Flavobacterium microcysteis]
MKSITLILFVVLAYSCHIKKEQKKDSGFPIPKKDSLFVEEELRQYKNCLFTEVYYRGLKRTYDRLGIDNKEFKKVEKLDLTYYFYSGEFNSAFMLDDKNRDKMFEKWLNDTKYGDVDEIVKGSFDMVRALDFYNSEDIKVYLDSLRIVEYKRIQDRYTTN